MVMILAVVGVVVIAAAALSISFFAGLSTAVHSQDAEIGVIEDKTGE